MSSRLQLAFCALVIVTVSAVVVVFLGDLHYHNSLSKLYGESNNDVQDGVSQIQSHIRKGAQLRPHHRHEKKSRLKQVTVTSMLSIAKASSSSSMPLDNDEISAVLTRMDTCLVATNMSLYFRSNGYYDRAQNNARLLLEGLRQVIPKFTTPYVVPCWNTTFLARRESSVPKQSTAKITGSIGRYKFSQLYKHPVDRTDLFKKISWTHRDDEVYIKQSVACLPKIFLLGFAKCGSTFLYCLLRRVLTSALNIEGRCEALKEPHWWVARAGKDNNRATLSPDYLSIYLLNFINAAKNREMNRPAVTIDASPNFISGWPHYSVGETMENYCLLPSLIPVVLPDSKYFITVRNPISNLYSGFWYSCTLRGNYLESLKYKGPDVFHERITTRIQYFNQCKNQGRPLDACLEGLKYLQYDTKFPPMCGRTRLGMVLYYFHIRKWLSVIPRERFHVFTLEELATQDLNSTGKVILDFLEIPSSTITLPDTVTCNKNSQNEIDYKHDPRLKMREDTRQILEEFFKPYNQMLADLLGDDKFLWSNH